MENTPNELSITIRGICLLQEMLKYPTLGITFNCKDFQGRE